MHWEKLMCSTDMALRGRVDQSLLPPNLVTSFHRPMETPFHEEVLGCTSDRTYTNMSKCTFWEEMP